MSDSVEDSTVVSFSTIRGFAQSLRPWQWYKQLIIFVPIAFSFQYFDVSDLTIWVRVVAGALVFCLAAGCVYVINDLMDIEEDRQHPRKKHRPIASGQLPPGVAAGIALPGLLVGPLVGWWIQPAFGALLGVYVLQNLLYSAGLKALVFVDLLIIGTGFVIRALAGVVLVGAPVSPWLIICTFFTALLLGIGKRWAELDVDAPDDAVRQSLEDYSFQMLQLMLFSVSGILLVSYSLYTFFVRPDAMMATIPFALYAVFRYCYLVIEEGLERPSEMFFDKPMMGNLILWALLVFGILYVLPSFSFGFFVETSIR